MMWTERLSFNPSIDIGRPPDALPSVSRCSHFFQVSEERRPLKRKERGDSTLPLQVSQKIANILGSPTSPAVQSAGHVPGYSGFSGSIHTGQLLSECGSAHLRQISMSSGSPESVTEVGLG